MEIHKTLIILFITTYLAIIVLGLIFINYVLNIKLSLIDVITSFFNPLASIDSLPPVMFLVNDVIGLHILLRGYEVLHGYVWELVTSIFVHANLAHLITNVVALLIVNYLVVGSIGPIPLRLYLLVFFTSGIAANIATTFVMPYMTSLGASSCIFGLLAYVAIMSIRVGGGYSLLLLLLIIFVISSLPIIGIPNILAHAVGVAVGLLIGLIVKRGKSVK